MQQFGPQFINNHLMPLLEEMLEDTVQREKDYLDKLFINGVLEDAEKKNLMDFYFNPARKNAGVPFTGDEEKKDRENFLNHFVNYIRSRGAKPEDRIRAFLPVLDETSTGPVKTVKWPADVKRNLFLLSYHIAENFEHDQISGLIEAREATGKPEDVEQAKKDRELLDKGMLMLVRDPATGDFTKYIRANELKTGDTAVQFLPPPTPEMDKVMEQGFVIPSAANLQAIAKNGAAPLPIQSIAQGGVSPQVAATASSYEQKPAAGMPDQVSSNDELTKSFQQRRGKAIVNHLAKLGFTAVGDVKFDANGHAMVKVKSGSDELLVSVDTRVPFDQDLKFPVTFQTGKHAGKSMTVDESRLDEAFQKIGGGLRTAGELYEDIDLSKKLGIKSDAYPEKAPEKPQPVPLVGQPQNPGALPGQPGGIPFKIPTGGGAKPMPMPTGGPGGTMGMEGMPFELPEERKAREMPKQPQGEGKEPVGIAYKPKPVPGVPSGSVMEAKAKLQQQQQEAALAGQPALAFGGPPVAPGRYGGIAAPVPGGGKKEKSHFGSAVLWSNVAGISTSLGGGFLMGQAYNSPAPQTAWNVVKGVVIAVSHFFPHFFG